MQISTIRHIHVHVCTLYFKCYAQSHYNKNNLINYFQNKLSLFLIFLYYDLLLPNYIKIQWDEQPKISIVELVFYFSDFDF